MPDLNKNRETETEPEHDGLDPLHVATGADSEPRGLLRIAADTGGTFTDIVLTAHDGTLLATHKLLSTPDDPSRAVLRGCREILETAGRRGEEYELVHGTTVATNAMLTRSGARVGLVVNKGMEGLLSIGRQNRPELYALHPRRGEPLVAGMDTWSYQGSPDGFAEYFDVESYYDGMADSVAICLVGPDRELEGSIGVSMVAETAGLDVHCSMDIAPDALEYERCCSTVANAKVARLMWDYLKKLDEGGQHKLSIMASDGGLVPVSVVSDKPILTMLSGPAGGALGALQAGMDSGFTRLVSFDMGGTSTDVALLDSAIPLERRMEIDGIPLRLPHIDIHTVGAGGGSIAWIDSGGALKVGPQSAGADPGPACYGRQDPGQPLATVTDAHVVLGNLPDGVLLAGSMELDREASLRVVSHLAKQLGLSTLECAEGILRIADQNMANAIRAVSSQRGHDPREYTLVPFGGAGGLHAVRLAELLGMKRILLPASPGLLSAVGMLSAPLRFSQSVRAGLVLDPDAVPSDPQTFDRLISELKQALVDQVRHAGIHSPDDIEEQLVLDLRYRGQDHELGVDYSLGNLATQFHELHEQRFGHSHPGQALELVSIHCSMELGRGSGVKQPSVDSAVAAKPSLLIDRSELSPYEQHDGPVTITEQSATTVVPSGWNLLTVQNGHILIQKDVEDDLALAGYETRNQQPVTSNHAIGVAGPNPDDPIELEIFRQLFAAVAEEMGNSLMRTAHSPNINQRRDFSCAVFDEQARMIAQAAHIPVHLGSMGTAVQAVLERFPLEEMEPGSHYIVNDPFSGGTHLPDITLVSPVVPPGETQPRFLVASRAHHSDVGGISPGSLPLSRHIDEEGIRIEPSILNGEMLKRICAASRTPDERRGDLNAQLASQLTGRRRLLEMCTAYGWQHVSAMASALLAYSERMMREVVAAIPDGTYEATDYMDGDGLDSVDVAIRVKLTVNGDQLTADFSATDDQLPGSINAVRAITLSALGYVLRLLAPNELPQNDGAMLPLNLVTRPGSLVDAQYPAAVAAGNVETSQRITDVLMQALALALPDRVPACSQGTMNNVLIGGTDPRTGQPFSYYETIAGGCGAGPEGPGESAMHSHMTNTLNTPIETISRRYPFRVIEYCKTFGCGGEGLHKGGEGLIRRYEFDAPCTVTLITERRTQRPPGAAGGGFGKPGANTHIRGDGLRVPLPGKCTIEVQPGDQLEIITPGGGGWGKAG